MPQKNARYCSKIFDPLPDLIRRRTLSFLISSHDLLVAKQVEYSVFTASSTKNHPKACHVVLLYFSLTYVMIITLEIRMHLAMHRQRV